MVETLTELTACEWLSAAAALVDPEAAIVEVGVYRGGSLAYLCEGAAQGYGAPVYGVDPWGMDGAYPTRPHMLKRYLPTDMSIAAEHAPTARLIHDFSTNAADTWAGEPIALLFIDAVHREPDVLTDFWAWRPRLAPHAVVAFDDHDERFDGVRRAVAKLVAAGEIAPIELIGNRLAVTNLQ